MGLDVWTEKENIGNGWVSGTRYTPWTSQHTLAAFSKNLNTWAQLTDSLLLNSCLWGMASACLRPLSFLTVNA